MSEEIKLTEKGVQEFLNSEKGFQGEVFFSNLIFPIFGEEKFHPSGKEMLEAEPALCAEAKKVGIKSVIHHGDIDVKFGSLYVFEIVVADRVALARNRVAVQGVVRRLMKSYTGAFMIFHYENTASWDWRFSFCCRRDGKEQTEAKRYTFLLGPNQSCRTAAQNFVKLAEKVHDRSATLDDLVSAFDVEALSREFFKKYTDHYNDFVKYVTGKSFKKVGGAWKEIDEGTSSAKMYADFGHDDKRVRDYVKKLLGRIVFLHFLQKKGWLGGRRGWSDGRPDFMLKLYQEASDRQKGDFLDAVLEPLFSAIDTRRKDDFYDTGVAAIGRVKVPYLNGGLFTRDALDEIPTKFPRDYFRDLLVFLSEYNFTIDENDPNDAEVGVDPEMLGRIFENLLEDNRDKGAYYTPKAIVEYMCRRSLAAYLAVGCDAAFVKRIEAFVNGHDAAKLSKDAAATLLKKLKSVRICDPAIGSGAFPMGLLREIRLCRETLEDRLADDADGAKKKAFARTDPATLTKEIIENNIYGVDIEKGAVDIARLRFWLALVVDEETPQALPNLDFKIMQGNSLLESFHGIDLGHLLTASVGGGKGRKKPVQATLGGDFGKPVQVELAFGDATARTVITEKMRQYYSESDHKAKKVLMDEISKQVNGFLAAHVTASDFKGELAALGPQNDKFFLWHTWFAEAFKDGGFDIVIGNPPYVKLEKIKDQSRVLADANYEVYVPRSDLYCLFTELGFNLLKKDGVISYIMPNKWLRADYGEPLRALFLKNRILCLIDFGDSKIFEDATVYPFIFVAEKDKSMSVVKAVTMKGYNSQTFIKDINDWSENLEIAKLSNSAWVLSSVEADMLKRITSECVTLKEFVHGEAFYGIKPGVTAAYIVNETTKQNIVNGDVKAAEIMVPMVRGRDVKPYYAPHTGMWFVGVHNGYGNIPAVDVKNYPTVKKWLDGFAEKLKARAGQGKTFYNLITIGYWERFAEPKIMYQQMQVKPCFVYDESGLFCNNSMWIIPTNKKELVGLLNSKMGWWLISKYCTQIQNGYQLLWEYFGKIPVPKKLPAELTKLVDQILSKKAANPSADTSSLEAEIDSLVFDLYGLTSAGRAIVLGKEK